MRRTSALAVVRCAAVLLGATGAAQAYVPTRSDEGTPIHWPMSCIVIAPDARGDTSASDVDLDAIDATLARAVANWNSRIRDCSYLKLGVARATRALEAVSDGRPSVVFRSERWGRGDRDYSPAAIGRTTVWFNTNQSSATDGLISDADIELNAVNFTFTTQPGATTALGGTMIADLENTLTHEIGHVLGLAHTCVASYDDSVAPQLDSQDREVPDCALGSALPAEVRNATMYPYADTGATGMRAISDDDVRGVCEPYPISAVPTACYGYIEGAGCSLGARRPGSGLPIGFALGGLCMLLALGRSRRGSLRSMSLSRFLVATGLVLSASACTVANPLYTPGGAADLGIQPGALSDLSNPSTVDLATKMGPDLAPPMAKCMDGARGCNTSSSLSCVGGVLQLDRLCPSSSACVGGYCQAPLLSNSGVGKNCDLSGEASETWCITGGGNTPTCTPFVDTSASNSGTPTDLIWRCAKPVGVGLPGTACIDGKQCRTGFCGSNGTCFRACAGGGDCPSGQSASFDCADVIITVEGVEVSAKSCVPN